MGDANYGRHRLHGRPKSQSQGKNRSNDSDGLHRSRTLRSGSSCGSRQPGTATAGVFTCRRRGNPSRSILAGRPTRYPRVEKIAQFAGGSDASIPHERVSRTHHPRTGREKSQRDGQLRLAQSGSGPLQDSFNQVSPPCRGFSPRHCRQVDGVRDRSPCHSPARSVSQRSTRTRASIRGAISSAHGTGGLSSHRLRAPTPQRPLLWIIRPSLAARSLFVFAVSTFLSPPTELCSARSPKGLSRGLDANRASPYAVRFLHSRLNRLSISPVRRELGAET